MGKITLICRLAARDLRHRPAQAVLLLLAITGFCRDRSAPSDGCSRCGTAHVSSEKDVDLVLCEHVVGYPC